MAHIHNGWTVRQETVLLDCRDNQDMSWVDIGLRIGKTASSCRNRYMKIKKQYPQNK